MARSSFHPPAPVNPRNRYQPSAASGRGTLAPLAVFFLGLLACGPLQAGWSHWEDLGGNLTSSPAAASFARQRLDVFARGSDGHLWQRYWDGRWHDWVDLGRILVKAGLGTKGHVVPGIKRIKRPLASAPACIAKEQRRLDCFMRDPDGRLWQRWWSRSDGWSRWTPLGGRITSAPAAASWDSGRIDLFARDGRHRLIHKWWNGKRWSDWVKRDEVGPMKLTSAPAAVARAGTTRIDLFVRGSGDKLWHSRWDGQRWQRWADLGGELASAPGVCSWGRDRLDVFARGRDGGLHHIWWNGKRWSRWQRLGGELTSAPACVARPGGRIDVFAKGRDAATGTDDTLLHIWYRR